MSIFKRRDIKQSDVDKAFKLPSETGLWNGPTTCVDCDGMLERNDDWDYNSEWWMSRTCTECGQKWRYMPSDMGQSLPSLERYESREETERDERNTDIENIEYER